jgi:hypothetical protein
MCPDVLFRDARTACTSRRDRIVAVESNVATCELFEEYWLMFRFTIQAPRALAATAAFVLLSATVAQAQTAPNGTPLPTRARRNASRQSRIARNIQDS